MKCTGAVVALCALVTSNGAHFDATPMSKVVTLLEKMKAKIETDAKSEQKSYDKFACWCEDTLKQKASDITKGKDKIDDLDTSIRKNKGLLGAGGATVAQLNKDIAENVESQKQATAVRKKGNSEYSSEKDASEESIGSLEAAIKVLTGAGTGKKGFLQNLQEAQLLSVVASVRPVLEANVVKQTVKAKDLKLVQHFVSKPEDFFNKPANPSALQTANNPFGDYAPGSGPVQGIFKSMYDTFTADLERSNAEEANEQKAFEELMATKQKEQKTLQSSLEDESKSFAEKTKKVADDKAMRDDTREQLDADQKFFAQTKDSCKTKSKQWSERNRLRTEELAGIGQAISTLGSKTAKKTFEAATKFLQVSAVVHPAKPRFEAYHRLSSLAARFQSLELAQIAIAARTKTTGHFDDVNAMIDKMIFVLRKEEKEDIAHRDRCEGKLNSNKNDKDDASTLKAKAQAEMKRLGQAQSDKNDEIKEISGNIKSTKKNIADVNDMRKKDRAEYKKALKADTDSISLLLRAKASLAKFYKDTSALQVDDTKPGKKEPRTNFDGSKTYKGSTGEARGVMAILDMLEEDLHKEVKVAGQQEAEAQASFAKDSSILAKAYQAARQSRTAAVVELADLKSDKQESTEARDAAQKDLNNEMKLRKAIKGGCKWVKTHFEKRRKSRKAEMSGLEDAKEFLSGVGTDDDLSMP